MKEKTEKTDANQRIDEFLINAQRKKERSIFRKRIMIIPLGAFIAFISFLIISILGFFLAIYRPCYSGWPHYPTWLPGVYFIVSLIVSISLAIWTGKIIYKNTNKISSEEG